MGSEIKGYSLLGKIAKGGMGEVFKAMHLGLNKEVILKKLSPKAPSAFYERFKREAVIMMDISHPNIVHMYDYFKEDGSSYIAMEYIPGYNLSEIVRKLGRLPVYLAAYVALELARGLQYAHQKGVIHRDIKPGNVLISTSGDIKLTDFGIAFKTESHSTDNMTRTGTILGTPAYMSPEQIQSSKDVDFRSDLYSLGILFYEMLTGKRPYNNEFSVDNLRKISKGKYHSIRTLNKNVPPKLVRIIKKLMHHDKAKRYSKSDHFIDDVTRFIDGKFKARDKLREQLAKIVNDDKGVVLSHFNYPGIYIFFDYLVKGVVLLAVLYGAFFAVKQISPGLIVQLISKHRYGVADIVVDAGREEGEIDLSLVSLDNENEYRYHFPKSGNGSRKNNLILPSDKYRAILKYNNTVEIREVFVKPFSIQKRNKIMLHITQPRERPVDLVLTVVNADTKDEIHNYKLFYRITGTETWSEYTESSVIINGAIYDFSIYANGFNPSAVTGIEISPWQQTALLNFVLTTRKAHLFIGVPPIPFTLTINGSQTGFEDKEMTKTVELSLKDTITSIYLPKGTYEFIFFNKQDTITLKKEVKVAGYADIKLSFVKDNEGDIYVVIR